MWLHSAGKAAEQENPVAALVHLAVSAGYWLGLLPSPSGLIHQQTSLHGGLRSGFQKDKGRRCKASEGMRLQNSHNITPATFY